MPGKYVNEIVNEVAGFPSFVDGEDWSIALPE
jgi:hypothetical protein